MTRRETFATIPAADVLPVTPRIGAEIRNIVLSADGLRAIHSSACDHAAQRTWASEQERRYRAEVFARTAYQTEHPVVRVYPQTGDRVLVPGVDGRASLPLTTA